MGGIKRIQRMLKGKTGHNIGAYQQVWAVLSIYKSRTQLISANRPRIEPTY